MIAAIVYGVVESYRSPHKTYGVGFILIGCYGLWMRWQARNDPVRLARMQRLTKRSIIFWVLCLLSGFLLWEVVQAR
jgi:hypothetical protein